MSTNIFIIDFEIIFSKILIIFVWVGRNDYLKSFPPKILLNNIPNNDPDNAL